MRWVVCAVVVFAFAPRAYAGDPDILRGTEPTYHWGGFYGGAQGGYSSSVVNFAQGASTELSFLLRDTAIEEDEHLSQWSVLGSRTPGNMSYGGFAGYNLEWEDVIVGAEVNYNHVGLSTSSSSALERTFTDSTNLPAGHHYFYTADLSGSSVVRITDVATFRARAGWEAGQFLPYAFAGFAVGRADYSTSATLAYTAVDFPDSETPPLTPLNNLTYGPTTQANSQNGAFAYGFAVGGGTDFALTPNIFVRGEYEYVQFAPVAGITATISTIRAGVGLKF
jgi:opacity protein-like surface antigen